MHEKQDTTVVSYYMLSAIRLYFRKQSYSNYEMWYVMHLKIYQKT